MTSHGQAALQIVSSWGWEAFPSLAAYQTEALYNLELCAAQKPFTCSENTGNNQEIIKFRLNLELKECLWDAGVLPVHGLLDHTGLLEKHLRKRRRVDCCCSLSLQIWDLGTHLLGSCRERVTKSNNLEK